MLVPLGLPHPIALSAGVQDQTDAAPNQCQAGAQDGPLASRLLALLGRGGMGEVYRALQHSMEREVAVKVMTGQASETAVRRFLKEARSVARLRHPNVITVFEFGSTEAGELYLVMELLDGRPLSAVIEQEGPLAPERAVELACQICDALEEAHAQDIVHRDLKPDNVFVRDAAGGRGEFVKVLDFGLAKVLSTEQTGALTQSGMVCGTPAYMSPEQGTAEEIGPPADIYSLGIVLYEMLSGCLPFQGQTPMQMMIAHVMNAPAPLRQSNPDIEVPATLERLLMQTLAKNPGRRPQTAAALRGALRDALVEHEASQVTTTLMAVDAHLSAVVETAPEPDVDVHGDTVAVEQMSEDQPSPGGGATAIVDQVRTVAVRQFTEDIEPVRPSPAPATRSRLGLWAGLLGLAIIVAAGVAWFAIDRGASVAPAPVPVAAAASERPTARARPAEPPSGRPPAAIASQHPPTTVAPTPPTVTPRTRASEMAAERRGPAGDPVVVVATPRPTRRAQRPRSPRTKPKPARRPKEPRRKVELW